MLIFPGGSDSKASAYSAGDLGSIPGSGRAPGEGNGTPLQYSCLENPVDRGAWWAAFYGVTKSQTRLSDFTFFQDDLTTAGRPGSNPGSVTNNASASRRCDLPGVQVPHL